MNTRMLATTFVLSAVLPLAAHSQSNTSSNSNNPSYATTGSSQANNSSDIHRISQDRLDTRLTASSLIGKKVVDRNGKDVGEVKDIGLSAVLPRDLQKQGDREHGTAARVGQEISDFSQRATRDVNVYVSVGGFMGIGDDLVAVPASRLSRDGDNLKIDMTQDHLKSIASNQSNSGASAASE